MSLNDVFGSAKYGSNGNRTHWFKLPKDGSGLVVRILPPYGSLKDSGKWSKYYVTHFGYADTKGKIRPFESPEVINRKTKMVEVPDPAMDRIKSLRTAQNKAIIEGNTELAKKISEQLKIFNAKKAHYLNVMDLEGRIGVLSIPHKMYLTLLEVIEELKQRNIDPISVNNGRFLVFSRSGVGVNTVHQVKIYRDPQTDAQVPSVLNEDVASRMKSEGVDLGNLYIRPTSEEVGQIVKANGGLVLEQVLAKYRKSNTSEVDASEVMEHEEELVQPSLPELTQKKNEDSTPTAPATNLSDISTEDFLKSIGVV